MSTLLIMAGGTGGHVYPALAVAERLRGRGVHVVWLGTRAGLEAKAVPAAGFEIEWLSVKGLKGKGWWGMVRTPFLVLLAMAQTVAVLLRRRPALLLGMGGFVAGPGGLTAWLLRRPLVIHESNALAGFTNRLLARLADRVLTGFPDTFAPSGKVVFVGNPVRAAIAAIDPPQQRMAGRKGPLRVLVIGGSQGARVFNEKLPDVFARLAPAERPQIWHQTGRERDAQVRAAYQSAGVSARVDPFIDDMADAYAWADLVVARAGAMTVAEITAAGVAAALVPFPHAADDHQTRNAQFLSNRGAALLVREKDVAARLPGLLRTPRGQLLQMAQQARALARSEATDTVADICMEYLSA